MKVKNTSWLGLQLYDWQQEAINIITKLSNEKQKTNNRDISNKTNNNYVIIAPTNSGKSLVAYYFLAIDKLDTESYVRFYTVPIKSLAYDKFNEIKQFVKNVIGKEELIRYVGLATGDTKVNINKHTRLIICTHEYYAQQKRQYNNKLVRAYHKVVIDEFHYYATDRARARTLIESIDHTGNSNTDTEYMFMSGTLRTDYNKLKQYLERLTGNRTVIIETDFTRAKLVRLPRPITDYRDLFARLKIIALANKDNDITIAFVLFNRVKLIDKAKELYTYLTGKTIDIPTKKAINSYKAFLDLQEQLSKASITVFYGDLPYPYRQYLQEQIANKRLKYVFVTDVIGIGLNLPIDVIVFLDLRKYDQYRQGLRPLTKAELLQIENRAGRSGKTGYVMHHIDCHRDYIRIHKRDIESFILEPGILESDLILNKLDTVLAKIDSLYSYYTDDTDRPKYTDTITEYVNNSEYSGIQYLLKFLCLSNQEKRILLSVPEIDTVLTTETLNRYKQYLYNEDQYVQTRLKELYEQAFNNDTSHSKLMLLDILIAIRDNTYKTELYNLLVEQAKMTISIRTLETIDKIFRHVYRDRSNIARQKLKQLVHVP